jgi:hypothetical protein
MTHSVHYITKRITPNQLNQTIEAAIKTAMEEVNFRRGDIRFYLNENTVFPLLTLEDSTDKHQVNRGAISISHSPKTWRLRATIQVDTQSQPDEELNDLLTSVRSALFFNPFYDFNEVKLIEVSDAIYSLPEPGLPLASVSLTLSAHFIEPL